MKRQAGFYWVYVKGERAPEVAMTSGDGWLLVGRVYPMVEDDAVTVLSEQLLPPQMRSGCVHPVEARHEGQCRVCMRLGITGP